MTDNELIALAISTLEPLVQDKFGSNVVMLQKDQPTQQGVPSEPTVYIEKLFDKRYGFTREDLDLSGGGVIPPPPPGADIPADYVQVIETTFQFSAFVLQDPSDLSIPTASDLVNYVAQLLSVRAILQTLREGGAMVMRSMQVRNPYYTDDRERFEASPSFDVVFQHERDISLTVPSITGVGVEIYPV